MTVRLTRKAQEKCDKMAAAFNQAIRALASAWAEKEGKEFVDEDSVSMGYGLLLDQIRVDVNALDAQSSSERK